MLSPSEGSESFRHDARSPASADGFSDWLEMMETIGRIFVYEHRAREIDARPAAQLAPIAAE
jgi:ABC-type Fe3+-hydroxamate transport system substrate-binding protein